MYNNLRVNLIKPRFKMFAGAIVVSIAAVEGGPPAHASCMAAIKVCAAKAWATKEAS